MLDGHIHIRTGSVERTQLIKRLDKVKIKGGLLISIQPETDGSADDYEERLDILFEWMGDDPHYFPFFWIDPLAVDAVDQTKAALNRNVAGFKIICDRFYPGDEKCLEICRIAAAAGKPVLFHSGILWDGKPSSEFCRPVHFEHLLQVDGLRFSLAHIGWPWCDETIAVYGKFLNYKSRNPGTATEMFIDMTPGTPLVYREEVISKLLLTGYDIENNLIFGTDCDANDYNSDWTKKWLETDNAVYDKLGISAETRLKIFGENLLDFINMSDEGREYSPLEPAVF